MRKWIFVLSLMIINVLSVGAFAETKQYYDENGNLIQKVTEDSMEIYTKDANGNSTFRIRYVGAENISSDNPVPSYYYEYFRSEDGKLGHYIQYEWTGDFEQKKVKAEYWYDTNLDGTTKSVTKYIGKDSLLNRVPYYVDQYFYDDEGYTIKRFMDEEMVTLTRYTLNENGDTALVEIFQGAEAIANNTPTTQTAFTYDYDKYGNKTAIYENGVLSTSNIYDPAFLKKQWLEHRKLIYTIEEANKVAGERNTVRIKYR